MACSRCGANTGMPASPFSWATRWEQAMQAQEQRKQLAVNLVDLIPELS